LKDILGIICYEKPENCTIGYLLDINQREILAEKLNAAILGFFLYKFIDVYFE